MTHSRQSGLHRRRSGVHRRRRGLSTLLFLLALPTLIIFTWLGVEVGLAIRSANQAKIAADAIALAAAARLQDGFEATRETALLAASINEGPSGAITVSMSEDNTGDVQRGTWDPSTRTFIAIPGGNGAIRATVSFGPNSPNGSPGIILPGIFELMDYEITRSSVAVPLPNIDGPSIGIAGSGLEMAGSSLLRSAGYVDVSLLTSGVLDLRGDSLIDAPMLRSDSGIPDQVADAVTGDVVTNTTLFEDPHAAKPPPLLQPQTDGDPEIGFLSPGLHADGLTVANGTLVLMPGIHQFGASGLQVIGDGRIILDRAMVHLVDVESTLTLRESARAEGVAMPNGPWRNVAFLATSEGPPLSIEQNATIEIDGDVYAPDRLIVLRNRGRLKAMASILGGIRLDQNALAEFTSAILREDDRGPSARLVR